MAIHDKNKREDILKENIVNPDKYKNTASDEDQKVNDDSISQTAREAMENPLEDEIRIPNNIKFTDPASGFPGKGSIRVSDDDLASDNV